CRKPMVWSDMIYEPEAVTVDQQPRAVDSVYFDYELFHYYRTLIHIRKNEIVLRKGEMNVLHFDNDKDILAFARKLGDELILILINNNEQPQVIELDKVAGQDWQNLLNGEKIKVQENRLKIQLQAKEGAILKRI
ncbi:alpha-glucosidase C-terminal domain-containing protein, partial [Caldithrix abyssi]